MIRGQFRGSEDLLPVLARVLEAVCPAPPIDAALEESQDNHRPFAARGGYTLSSEVCTLESLGVSASQAEVLVQSPLLELVGDLGTEHAALRAAARPFGKHFCLARSEKRLAAAALWVVHVRYWGSYAD